MLVETVEDLRGNYCSDGDGLRSKNPQALVVGSFKIIQHTT